MDTLTIQTVFGRIKKKVEKKRFKFFFQHFDFVFQLLQMKMDQTQKQPNH